MTRAVGMIATVMVLGAVAAVARGFVLMHCWAWFIVPVFTNVPALTLGSAIGLSFVVQLLTLHAARTSDGAKAQAKDWFPKHVAAAIGMTVVGYP